ncbi:MAG: putative transport system permease protein [Verrucomicrobiota bacterium]|jgi:putative ABC transport system permease protein
MTFAGYIARNALRNKRRFFFTFGSVGVSLFLLTMLQVVLRGLTDPATTEEAALRVVVRHKVSLANMLFAKYRAQLEKMQGVRAVTKLLWFGGIYRDEKNFFPQFACDAGSLFQVLVEARLDPRQRDQFIHQRNACVVGIKTMERFGWRPGDRITLLGAMWPCDVELEIAGAYAGGLDETPLYFHHEYFDELIGDPGITGLLWVRAENAGAAAELPGRIDAAFANSSAETFTETESAFQIGFVSMLGNVRALIAAISSVIVFTLLLVTSGTMSMAVRERAKEIAILKAVGFDGTRVFGLIMAESFALALAGGMAACALAWLVVRIVDIRRLSRGLFVNFEVTPTIAAVSIAVAGVAGVLSCLLPAWSSVRRSVVDGLRTVE